MVLLALPPADHLPIERDRGQFVPSRRRRMMANVGAERLLKIPQNPAPSCVSPALQLKREWSPWPEFGWIPANLCDLSGFRVIQLLPGAGPASAARVLDRVGEQSHLMRGL